MGVFGSGSLEGGDSQTGTFFIDKICSSGTWTSALEYLIIATAVAVRGDM